MSSDSDSYSSSSQTAAAATRYGRTPKGLHSSSPYTPSHSVGSGSPGPGVPGILCNSRSPSFALLLPTSASPASASGLGSGPGSASVFDSDTKVTTSISSSDTIESSDGPGTKSPRYARQQKRRSARRERSNSTSLVEVAEAYQQEPPFAAASSAVHSPTSRHFSFSDAATAAAATEATVATAAAAGRRSNVQQKQKQRGQLRRSKSARSLTPRSRGRRPSSSNQLISPRLSARLPASERLALAALRREEAKQQRKQHTRALRAEVRAEMLQRRKQLSAAAKSTAGSDPLQQELLRAQADAVDMLREMPRDAAARAAWFAAQRVSGDSRRGLVNRKQRNAQRQQANHEHNYRRQRNVQHRSGHHQSDSGSYASRGVPKLDLGLVNNSDAKHAHDGYQGQGERGSDIPDIELEGDLSDSDGEFEDEIAVPVGVSNDNLLAPKEYLQPEALWRPTERFFDSKLASTARYTALPDVNPFQMQGMCIMKHEQFRKDIKHLVVITMYNEEYSSLQQTLISVAANINRYCVRYRQQKTDGSTSARDCDVWKHWAVVIVVDGMDRANKGTLDYAASLGLWNPSEMASQDDIEKYNIQLHMYETIVALSSFTGDDTLDSDNDDDDDGHDNDKDGSDDNEDSYKISFADDGHYDIESVHHGRYHRTRKSRNVHLMTPVQTIFCIKQHNRGKLDSHNWFFSGIAECLNPRVCYTLDVGTVARPDALIHLYDALINDRSLGGVTGEITASNLDLFNPVVAAQAFEYKISHTLDKAFESALGYITVLPGAFSAYWFKCIRPRIKGKQLTGPLVSYFDAEHKNAMELGPLVSNMYLAEDRILCYEIVSQSERGYRLGFVKDAVVETDVPETLPDLINQRRRWNNGAFFALLWTIFHFGKVVFYSGHSLTQKFVFLNQWLFLITNALLSWFSCATLFLTIYFVLGHFVESNGWPPEFISILIVLYASVSLIQLVLASGNRAQSVRGWYILSSIVYGAILMIVAVLGVIMIATETSWAAYIGAVLAFGIVLITPILFNLRDVRLVALTFVQYLFMLATFVNIFTLRSFANMHDISWGTKGNTSTPSSIRAAQMKKAQAMKNQQAANAGKAKVKQPSETTVAVVDGATTTTGGTIAALPGDGVHDYCGTFEFADQRAVQQRAADQQYIQTLMRLKVTSVYVDVNAYKLDEARDRFANFRTNLFISFLLTNAVFIGLIVNFIDGSDFLVAILYIVCVYNSTRFLGVIVYRLSMIRCWANRSICYPRRKFGQEPVGLLTPRRNKR
jgi:cellulose synthase/poly-beta-1,6-N-acetylglucosamine synthase-like glycosyltransferase